MKRKGKTPEGYVKKAVEDLLKASRIPYWRMQSGGVYRGKGNYIRLNAKGTADILAAPVCLYTLEHFQNDTRYEIDQLLHSFLWIETKAPGGKPSKEQLQFAYFVRERGHHHLFVDDVRQLAEWLKENKAR